MTYLRLVKQRLGPTSEMRDDDEDIWFFMFQSLKSERPATCGT